MDEERLADVVATAYEAASGGSTWFDFGNALCGLLGAQRCTLRLVDGSLTNLLAPADAADAAYRAHFHRVDPYRKHAAEAKARPHPNTAQIGALIIPPSELYRTEYFNDYAARHGQHHMLGGSVGLRRPLPIGLHRDAAAGAFTDVDRRALEHVLPHLQRALQLRERLALQAGTNAISTAALDALPACVIVVDGTMRVVHANAAGADLTSPGRSGLTISRAAFGGMQLSARHRDDNDALRRLIVRTVAGGSGGVLRIRARSDDVPEEATLAVLVSQIPGHLMTSGAGLAIIVAREMSRPERVPERMLSDLYSLTAAEAAVAGALAGGIKAEDVARERGVSLDTVRTQVRTVLRKTNAANLRDFERIVALLSAA